MLVCAMLLYYCLFLQLWRMAHLSYPFLYILLTRRWR